MQLFFLSQWTVTLYPQAKDRLLSSPPHPLIPSLLHPQAPWPVRNLTKHFQWFHSPAGTLSSTPSLSSNSSFPS